MRIVFLPSMGTQSSFPIQSLSQDAPAIYGNVTVKQLIEDWLAVNPKGSIILDGKNVEHKSNESAALLSGATFRPT